MGESSLRMRGARAAEGRSEPGLRPAPALMLLAALAGLVVWAISSGFLSAGAAPVIVDVSVASAADDVEETPGGSVDSSSSDLELVTDGGKAQTRAI